MPLLDRDDCVLVVVDVQPGFAAEAEAAVERAAWLVGVAMSLGVPVVVTEEDAAANGPTDPRVLPDGAPVFDKPTFGLAGTPSILDAIRSTGRSTVVLVGFETDVCIAQSAIGLVEERFRAVVATDATFSPGEMHEHGLRRIAGAGGELNHCKGIYYEWLRRVDAIPPGHQAPFPL
jgi:nicotinamidase-related amidase